MNHGAMNSVPSKYSIRDDLSLALRFICLPSSNDNKVMCRYDQIPVPVLRQIIVNDNSFSIGISRLFHTFSKFLMSGNELILHVSERFVITLILLRCEILPIWVICVVVAQSVGVHVFFVSAFVNTKDGAAPYSISRKKSFTSS